MSSYRRDTWKGNCHHRPQKNILERTTTDWRSDWELTRRQEARVCGRFEAGLYLSCLCEKRLFKKPTRLHMLI
jgi:hypothetical protein